MNFPLRTSNSFWANLSWNAASAIVYAFLLQIVIFPGIASSGNSVSFGEFLAVMAVINISSHFVGGAASNLVMRASTTTADVRTLSFAKANGTFLVLLVGTLPFVIAATALMPRDDFVLCTLAYILFASRLYCLSPFRLTLDYKRVAIANSFCGVAYLPGLLLLENFPQISPVWLVCIAEFTSLLFLIKNSPIFESGSQPKKPNSYLGQVFGLAITNLSVNLQTYADRLILSKFIGFNAVSVFYAAALSGRLLMMPTNTVSSVVLSYVSHQSRLDIRSSKIILATLSLVGLISVVLASISPIVIRLLYPQFEDLALNIRASVSLALSCKIAECLFRPLTIKLLPVRLLSSITVSYTHLTLPTTPYV